MSPSTSAQETVVHVLRHGEVHNPEGILYGRKPGFHLSTRGNAMAQRIAATIGDRDITHVIASPLERAQETAAPTAAARGLEIITDDRVIESENEFEGTPFSLGSLTQPQLWPKLWNPFTPSWGEPYVDIARRMSAAIKDARAMAEGHEAVVVSHQLPIWIARLAAEGRWFVHDPRSRRCSVCSLTSFHFRGGRLLRVSYSEPAADMIPISERGKNFSSGGGDDEPAPRAIVTATVTVTKTRVRRAATAVALALGLALGAAACTDDGLDTGGEKGYVSGDGRVATFTGEDRRQVSVDQVVGPELGGAGEISLADFRGRVVVLNVWGSWCPPCRAEAPDLVAAYDELGAGVDADVVFLGVDIREPSEAPAEAFERTFEIPYPSIYDPGGQSLLPFGLPAVPPTTVVLDGRGRIAATVLGELPSSGTLVDLVQDVQAAS